MSPQAEAQELDERLSPEELHEAWGLLAHDDRVEGFRLLDRAIAEDFFLSLSSRDQAELLAELPRVQRRSWLRLLPLDDAADLIQEFPEEERESLLELFDESTRKELMGLLAYAEDRAGGLMNPKYARVRPDMSVDEAIAYLRRQARERIEYIYYVYVLDAAQHLLGVVTFRELFAARPEQRVREVMRTDIVTVPEEMDQEHVSQLFARHDLAAIPVVDTEGRIKGIVTVDDIVDVVQEEATEDIQKIGGTSALDAPYLEVGVAGMMRKRAGWLSVLFLGEMLTTTAMAYFESELERAIVLAVFIPLIISSGGNSGSQATTLVIRAMALDEIRLRDWYRVVRREFFSGLGLGAILGALGFVRVLAGGAYFDTYGEHYVLVGITVATSLVGVVLWGTLAGSMLPFVLRKLGFDPASASAPFVATLVDVCGILIYFGLASFILAGTLL
ncbi:MAG: magnesium transporter [Thermodesulfobacteriota bacterium]